MGIAKGDIFIHFSFKGTGKGCNAEDVKKIYMSLKTSDERVTTGNIAVTAHLTSKLSINQCNFTITSV